jgi:hypothetical protein
MSRSPLKREFNVAKRVNHLAEHQLKSHWSLTQNPEATGICAGQSSFC